MFWLSRSQNHLKVSATRQSIFSITYQMKGRTVSADVRNYYAHKLLSMSVRNMVQSLYPTLLALHDLEEDIALPDPATGKLSWPTQMRASHVYMSAHGLYLIGEYSIFGINVLKSNPLL